MRLTLAVLMLFATSVVSAQSDDKPTTPVAEPPSANGTHAFRYILHHLHLKPLQDWEALDDDAERTLLVVFGDTNELGKFDLKGYLGKGGAMLLATDREMDLKLVQLFQVGVVPETIRVHDPMDRYEVAPGKRNELCPLVNQLNADYAIFRGVQHIATNRPGYLDIVPDRDPRRKPEIPFHPIAFFPLCDLPNGKGLARGVGPPFAMEYKSDDSRALLLSDHSVFINAMLLRSNNDNFSFAYNCVHWLTERGKDERRNRVLFVNEHGVIETHFDVTAKPPTPPMPPSLPPGGLPELPVPTVEVMNQFLRDLERENVFNQMLLSRHSIRQIVSALAIVLTACMLLYGIVRLIRARHRAELNL